MTGTYILRKGVSTLNDLVGGRAGIGLGIGNIYYVVKSTEAFYGDLSATYDQVYNDGSVAMHTSIESALAATVECRNDYVVVWPSNSDYDIDTAALVMNKKSVHLIAPSGMGYDRGASNAVRVEQTTDSIPLIAVSDAAIEIAGFYFKPYIGQSHITLSAAAYAPNIHHNTFVLQWETTNKASIMGTGSGGGWGSIERNWFISQGGDSQSADYIVYIASSATGARVCYNDFMIGDGNTAVLGIRLDAYKGSANYNTFAKSGSYGTYTHCIQIGTKGSAIGNRGTVATSIMLTGGAQHNSASDNMDGTSGGVIDDGEA